MLELSEQANNAMLDVLGTMMDGGHIELLTADGRAIAVLNLSDPAAQDASGGEIAFNEIAKEDARAQGLAEIARIIASDGSVVFSCDVGDENSEAVVKLRGTAMVYRGQSVELKSFRLAMP